MTLRLITIILLSAPLLSVRAVDRYVSHVPQSGAYTTIAGALADSNDGDRIIIDPGSTLYAESFTIDRSVQLLRGLPSDPLNPYVLIDGTISLGATAIKEIMIQGLRHGNTNNFNIVSSTQPTGARSTVTVDHCSLIELMVTHPNWNVRINESTMDLARYNVGTITGCAVYSWRVGNEAAPGMTNRAIGTRITSPFAIPDMRSYYGNTQVPLHMEGCYISTNMPGGSTAFTLATASALAPHELINNTFNHQVPASTGAPNATLYYSGTEAFSLILRNNLFVLGASPLPVDPFPAVAVAATVAVLSVYNMESLGFSASAIPIQSSGQFSTALIATWHALPAGSAARDAGDPAHGYDDLDLTRNDIGCSGGSSPRISYNTDYGTLSTVDLVLAPRTVVAGGTMVVTIDGADR